MVTCPEKVAHGTAATTAVSVRARPARLSALRVLHRKSVLYGGFVSPRRVLSSPKWRFPARAVCVGAGVVVAAHHAGGASRLLRRLLRVYVVAQEPQKGGTSAAGRGRVPPSAVSRRHPHSMYGNPSQVWNRFLERRWELDRSTRA